jgi:hypothetical protein
MLKVLNYHELPIQFKSLLDSPDDNTTLCVTHRPHLKLEQLHLGCQCLAKNDHLFFNLWKFAISLAVHGPGLF